VSKFDFYVKEHAANLIMINSEQESVKMDKEIEKVVCSSTRRRV
jgi:hypothetical protein